jgi:hypothetical protein
MGGNEATLALDFCPGHFCSLQKPYDFKMINWSVSKGIPPGGPGIIEIEIAIEIGKLPGVDFDHDFDFDSDSELPRFENKLALDFCLTRIDTQPGT